MRIIFILAMVFGTLTLTCKAQNFIGDTRAIIADSMKKRDIFDAGVKKSDNGNSILTYLNYMHKDGRSKLNEPRLMSAQFILKNNKCEVEIYLYDNIVLNKFLATYADTFKYKAINGSEWVDIKKGIAIKIIQSPKQKVFLIQYKLIS